MSVVPATDHSSTTTAQPPEPDHSTQARVSTNSACTSNASTNTTTPQSRIHQFIVRPCPKSRALAAKTLSLVVFVLSIVVLWAAVSSSADSRRATRIAEWTSKKDFFEFCEEHSWSGSLCEGLRIATLEAPPGFASDDWKRWDGKSPKAEQISRTSKSKDIGQLVWCLACSSLIMGLLLSHRKVQRRLLNFSKQRLSTCRSCLMKGASPMRKLFTTVLQRRNWHAGDEERGRALHGYSSEALNSPEHGDMREAIHDETHRNIGQPAMNTTQDKGEEDATPVHAPTEEDEDWPEWAVEFEEPGNDGHPESEELNIPADMDRGYDLRHDDWIYSQILSQHRYRYDPYLDEHNPVEKQRYTNFKRRRQEQGHAARLQKPGWKLLVDNDHTGIPAEELYAEESYDVNGGRRESARRRSRRNRHPGPRDDNGDYY